MFNLDDLRYGGHWSCYKNITLLEMQKELDITAVIGFSGRFWLIQGTSSMDFYYTPIMSILCTHLGPQWSLGIFSHDPKPSSGDIIITSHVRSKVCSNQDLQGWQISCQCWTLLPRSSCRSFTLGFREKINQA